MSFSASRSMWWLHYATRQMLSARYGLARGEFLHRPFPDPASVAGSNAEKMLAFREVRDEIANEVASLLAR
jgi:hypothetical protein